MKISEKIKLLRKTNNLTQEEFAKSIGISRGNLANIELGNVEPTPMFINCVSLMYNIEKDWLANENNDDLSCLNGSINIVAMIMDKYEQLNDQYKKFIVNQMNELLEMQNDE